MVGLRAPVGHKTYKDVSAKRLLSSPKSPLRKSRQGFQSFAAHDATLTSDARRTDRCGPGGCAKASGVMETELKGVIQPCRRQNRTYEYDALMIYSYIFEKSLLWSRTRTAATFVPPHHVGGRAT